jgi:A/G-specific adenine glycosylase
MTMKHLSPLEVTQFQQEIKTFYAKNRREMPWREPDSDGAYNPYHILVSEIMLQQTQVARVVPKYIDFITTYPSVQALAAAELSDVLKLWSGLGYNRRAKFLFQTACILTMDYEGELPHDAAKLQTLPGIGANTAAAICAYAWNAPVVFIETNIRTVFLHYFFTNEENVKDADILSLVEQTLPENNIRDWYYALMDVGADFKAKLGNQNVRSSAYIKQKVFNGSARQIRGKVLKILANAPVSKKDICKIISDKRVEGILDDLIKEQLIHYAQKKYHLG